jgi:hypothetical protein
MIKSGSGQQSQTEQVFHPNSPVARLAQLGIIAKGSIAPDGGAKVPPSTPGGGTTGEPVMPLEHFVANLGASITLAQLSLSQPPTEGSLNLPTFQLRNITLNLNAQVEWGTDGSVSVRPPARAGEPNALPSSTVTITFDPFPLVPSTTVTPGN